MEVEDMKTAVSNARSKADTQELITRLCAGLSSHDENEKLVAVTAMQKALLSKDGQQVLVSYVLASPQCAELIGTWQDASGSPSAISVMLLLYYMFKPHQYNDEEAGEDWERERVTVKLRLDKVGRSLIRQHMKVLYSHLSSNQRSRQNGALLLLTSLVLRDKVLATEIATNFDFSLEALKKLARVAKEQNAETGKTATLKRPTRFAFVDFAMSFLEVGDPSLLRWVLQKRPLYAGVLHSISKDSETVMVKVLVLLKEVVLAPESLVPRALQSVLFGDATLDQLARISADTSLKLASQFSFEILSDLCTDPSHGLCPENGGILETSKGDTGAFGGGPARLLRLMNRLKVTEVDAHKRLLLATARASPRIAAAYLASFPLCLEPRVSAYWFRAMGLISMLMPATIQASLFASVAAQGMPAPSLDGSLVQTFLLGVLPPALPRVLLNKGLQHADILVQHACLRIVYEALLCMMRLVEELHAAARSARAQVLGGSGGPTMISFAAKKSSQRWSVESSWVSLGRALQDVVRARLPDPNILYGMLNSFRVCVSEHDHESGAVEQARNVLLGKRKRNGTQTPYGETQMSSDDKRDFQETIILFWGSEALSDAGSREDGHVLLRAKTIEVLAAYQRVLPVAVRDTGFDAFKLLPEDPTSIPVVQQRALTTLLLTITGHTTEFSGEFFAVSGKLVGSGSSTSVYKRVKSLLLLMVTTRADQVRRNACDILERMLVSTGAFGNTPWEIRLWLDALDSWKNRGGCKRDDKADLPVNDSLPAGTLYAGVVDFLAEALGNLYQYSYMYLERLYQSLSQISLTDLLSNNSPVSKRDFGGAGFGPFVLAVLDSIKRFMSSGKKTSSQRAAVATYVLSVFLVLLKSQVQPKLLASLLMGELASGAGITALSRDDCSSLKLLLHHCQSELQHERVDTRLWQAHIVSTGKLRALLKASRNDVNAVVESKREVLRALLVCIHGRELVDIFPSLMEACVNTFDGDTSVSSLLSLHQNLLDDIWTAWPGLFSLGLQLAGSASDRGGEYVTSSDISMAVVKSVDESLLSGAVGFSNVLLRCSFTSLFWAALYGSNGRLLQHHAFTKVLFAVGLQVPARSRLCAVRVVITGISYICTVFSEPIAELKTCFNLLCSLLTPTPGSSASSDLDAQGLERSSLFEHLGVVVKDILYHPALHAGFLCSGVCTGSFQPVMTSSNENRDLEVCDARMELYLAKAASGLNAFDGHILVLLTSIKELVESLQLRATSPSLEEQLHNLREEVQQAFGTFSRKAVKVFKQEIVEAFNSEVPASSASFALSFLLPLSDLTVAHDLIVWLFSRGGFKGSKRKQDVSIETVALHFTFLFMRSCFLSECTTTKKREETKRMRRLNRTGDSLIIFELYAKVLKRFLENSSITADLCMFSFLRAFETSAALSPEEASQDICRFADLARCTPLGVLQHCLGSASFVTASIATLLVKSCPLHLSEFGWLVALGTADREQFTSSSPLSGVDQIFKGNRKGRTIGATLLDEDLFTFLPVVKLYLEAKVADGPDYEKEVAKHVAAIYLKYLGQQLKSWDKLMSKEAVRKWFVHGSSWWFSQNDTRHPFVLMMDYCNQSPLGQVVQVVRLCHAYDKRIRKLRKAVVDALLPKYNTSFFSKEGEDSVERCIGRNVCEVVGKIYAVRSFLGDAKLSSRAVGSENVENQGVESDYDAHQADARLKLLGCLVQTLSTIYGLSSIDSEKEKVNAFIANGAELSSLHWSLFLEQVLLAQIMLTVQELSELPVDIQYFRNVFKHSITILLGHRFGEPGAMRVARHLTVLFLHLLSEENGADGQLETFDALELLMSHSRFLSSLLSKQPGPMEIPHLSENHVGKGTALTSLTSVLNLLRTPTLDSECRVEEDEPKTCAQFALYDVVLNTPSCWLKESVRGSCQKLETVKLLGVFVSLRLKQFKLNFKGLTFPPLEELLSLLLAAYGGTLNEIDKEIFSLMGELESYGGPGFPGLAGFDYLWGEAALKRRKSKVSGSCSMKDGCSDGSREFRRQTIKEDLVIDPRRCGLTVLFFPYSKPVTAGKNTLLQEQLDSLQKHRNSRFGTVEKQLRSAAYDPAFLLPFATYSLRSGGITVEEFARLGFLAVALTSISSRDDTMRKMGYNALAKLQDEIETCQSFKSMTQIRLLLTHVKNSVTEVWQRVPLVWSVFAAEASCILMSPEDHRYATVNRFLLRSSSSNTESIPLFQLMFGNGSLLYRSEGLWMFRLLATGLGSAIDARLFRRNFVLELLMSLYDSSMTDALTRKWVLQVLLHASRVRSYCKYLVTHAGLLSWLASVAGRDCEHRAGISGPGEVAFMSLKVMESILSWVVIQRHLVTGRAEELASVVCLFERFLFSKSTPQFQKVIVRLMITLMNLLQRTSQQRRRHKIGFDLSIVAVQEVISWIEGGQFAAESIESGELRIHCLKMILHSSPPRVVTKQERIVLYNVAAWAVRVAMLAELETPRGCLDAGVPRRSEEPAVHGTLLVKVLQWLAAALLLPGRTKVKELKLSRGSLISCSTVVTLLIKDKSDTPVKGVSADEKLAELLLSVQGRLRQWSTNVPLLVSVVAAVSVLCPLPTRGFNQVSKSTAKITSALQFLLSELPCPEELNASWQWSFRDSGTCSEFGYSEKEGKVHAMFVCGVCETVFTIYRLVWSQQVELLSSYLADLVPRLLEAQMLSSSCEEDLSMYKRFVKLQDALRLVVEQVSSDYYYSNKSESS